MEKGLERDWGNMTEKNIHGEHRKRMRTKLSKYGGDVFEPHELLEMLLYFSISQKNTNPTAHALLEDYKSCLRLLESSPEQMQQTKGVGPASAQLIKMSGIFSRRAILEELKSSPLENTFQRSLYLYLWYRGKPASTVTALLLDENCRVIENAVLSQGRYIRPQSYGDLIISLAEQHQARGVILAHNHANNVREASVEDLYLTGQIRNMLSDSPYTFYGHYIVTSTDCFPCADV